MFSIVICSLNQKFLAAVKENIDATIGVEYELLIWDNRIENKGLCEVYNIMAEKARFPFICFCHEDILYQTQDWGKKLLKIFEADSQIALVGIAGTKYKSKMLSGWFTGIAQFDYYNIVHDVNGRREILLRPYEWESAEQEVVCIDGVFMVCRKSVWNNEKFNEQLLRGFHFYDIDFSLRVSRSHKVIVTNQINILHITQGGDYGDRWVEQAFIYHSSMAGLLPASTMPVVQEGVDSIIANSWLDRLKTEKVSFSNKVKWIKLQKLDKDPKLWYSIFKFLVYKPLGIQAFHNFFKKKF